MFKIVFKLGYSMIISCYEQIKEVEKLRQKDAKAKWTDPEFGATRN